MGQIVNVMEMVEKRRAMLREATAKLETEHGIKPVMKVVLVGEHPASMSYVKGKEKVAGTLGIDSETLCFPDTLSQDELLTIIKELNENPSVNGYIVQLPLPAHIDESAIVNAVNPAKDIDGFHPIHLGRLMLNEPTLVSCTPKGVMQILSDLSLDLTGKHVVVVGRSNIVGKPVSLLALNEHATVSICHSRTQDLGSITRQADILIVAVGIANFITDEHIKEGATIVDVGINRTSEGKLVGDVDTASVLDKCQFVTPVPRGVGPMTITMLMQNLIEATLLQKNMDVKNYL